MTDGAIRAIGTRTTNAELMRDCAQLGYLNGRVLDMTYGLGRFWNLHRPTTMVTNDLNESTDAMFHRDFTKLPFPDGTFRSVVLDAPYKLNGTGGSHASDEGYGVADKLTVNERMALMYNGLAEARRLASYGAHILFKCQDQVVSGNKVWQTIEFANYGQNLLDLKLIDMLHVSSYRAQPSGRRQLHSRGDYSTLLVFVKPF